MTVTCKTIPARLLSHNLLHLISLIWSNIRRFDNLLLLWKSISIQVIKRMYDKILKCWYIGQENIEKTGTFCNMLILTPKYSLSFIRREVFTTLGQAGFIVGLTETVRIIFEHHIVSQRLQLFLFVILNFGLTLA